MKRVIPKFVVFEGIDGSGKSSLIEGIQLVLNTRKIRSWATSEPTRSPIGLVIRNKLLEGVAITYPSLAYLFAADRYEHLYGPEGIINKAKHYDVVLCDRYLFSSLAYQCYQSHTLTNSLAFFLNKDFPYPELIIYLDNSPSLSLERLISKQLTLDHPYTSNRTANNQPDTSQPDTSQPDTSQPDNKNHLSNNVLENSGLQSPENTKDLTRIYKNYDTILDYIETNSSTRVYRFDAQLSKETLVNNTLSVLLEYLS